MLKHKKLLSALLAAVMLFTVTGCGGTDDEAEDAGATSWEETANITATDETDEELYEQAIAEGGEVTVLHLLRAQGGGGLHGQVPRNHLHAL